MITRLRPHLDKLLLASIFLVLSTSTILWTLRDRTPPAWDPSDHLRYGYDYYRLIASFDFAGFARELFTAHHYYTPLVHLISAAVFLIFGASRLTGLFVNLLSLAGMLWAVASISRRLYADAPGASQPTVALSVLPALIAVCYHFSAWLMHDAFLDFPLTAAVTIGFALLIRAGDFRVRRDALAFGAAAGIGLLVKQTFAFFFVLAAVYVAIRVLRTRDRRAVLNLALAGAIAVLIALVWYWPHWQDVMAIYRENRLAAANENEAPLFTFDSNFFYVHALISMQMQLPLALLFVGGIAYSLIRYRTQSLILYLWLVSGIAIFALVANKDVRYTVPVLPAVAILSVGWLREFKRSVTDRHPAARALKLALVAAIAAWSLVSFFNAQWPRPGWGTAIDTPRYRWMVFSRNYYGFDHRPLDEDWNVPEIVQTVATLPKDSRTTDQLNSAPVLGVVVNLPYLSPSSVALYSRLLTHQRAGPPLVDVRWIVERSMLYRIDECDFVMVRTGLDDAEWVAGVERDVERLIHDNPGRFVRVAGFSIPLKNAESVIYRTEQNRQ